MAAINPNDITAEVMGIERRPNGKLVTVQVTQPVKFPVTLPLSVRARARALVSVGVVDVTVDKVAAMDIKRFTEIESSRTVTEGNISRIKEYEVLVKNRDY